MFAFVPKKLTFHPLRVQYLLAGTSQVSYRHWRMWEDYLNDHNMPTKRIMNLLFFNQTYLNTSISRSVFAVTCSGHSIKIINPSRGGGGRLSIRACLNPPRGNKLPGGRVTFEKIEGQMVGKSVIMVTCICEIAHISYLKGFCKIISVVSRIALSFSGGV